MKIINLTLNDDELIILRGLKGEAIKNFKGYELFSDLAMWHETLVFRTGKKGFCIENQFKPVPFSNDEGEEDFAVLSVSNRSEEIWLPAGMKPKIEKVGKTIQDVVVVNCQVEYKNVELDTNVFNFTQAVVFCFDDCSLVINRDIWFNDFLTVKVVDDYKNEIWDVSEDWMCEDDEYVEVGQSFVKLT